MSDEVWKFFAYTDDSDFVIIDWTIIPVPVYKNLCIYSNAYIPWYMKDVTPCQCACPLFNSLTTLPTGCTELT